MSVIYYGLEIMPGIGIKNRKNDLIFTFCGTDILAEKSDINQMII